MNIFMIILTLVILSLLVIVHEWGHYIVAKKMGVYVIEFSIGMGPKLFSINKMDTVFSIRAFPIGGFCRMYGESDSDDSSEQIELQEDLNESRSFRTKTKIQRFLILVSGAAMNIVFAFICLIIVYLIKDGFTGLVIIKAMQTAWEFASIIIKSLGMLVSGNTGINDFAGPIGMVSIVSDYFQYGVSALLLFIALISINLGIINLLPLPALDGGQALIIIVEQLVGHDLNPKITDFINLAGFIVLITFSLMIAFNDILRLIG